MSISDIRDITSFKWATVMAVGPLAIQLDGDSNPLALIPDSLIDPLSLSVGDRVRVELSLRKVVIHGVSSGVATTPTGVVEGFFGATAPNGWRLLNGQSLLVASDPGLFAIFGYSQGGSGTNFNLPDARERTLVGMSSGSAEFGSLGALFGAKTHTLTAPQIANHRHWLGPNNGGNVGYSEGGGTTAYTTGFGSTRTSNDLSSGNMRDTSGQPHNNIQPSIAVNFIIKR